MSDNPFFYPGKMSDDELLAKQSKLSENIVFASRMGWSGELIEQMKNLISAIEFERLERMQMDVWNQMAPVLTATINSDPEFSNSGRDEAEKPERVRPDRHRSVLSSRPTPLGAPPSVTPDAPPEPSKKE